MYSHLFGGVAVAQDLFPEFRLATWLRCKVYWLLSPFHPPLASQQQLVVTCQHVSMCPCDQGSVLQCINNFFLLLFTFSLS